MDAISALIGIIQIHFPSRAESPETADRIHAIANAVGARTM
jgi:hypothetical protein